MGNVISTIFSDKLFYEQIFKPQVKHTISVVAENETIISQGDKQPFFCFIKSGGVKIVLNEMLFDQRPISTIVTTLSQNDIFGEFRIFDDYPASADVVAVKESEIVKIDTKSFMVFLDSDPQFGYKVFQEMLRVLVKRFHHSNNTVMHLMKSAVDFQRQLHQLIQEK